MFDAAVAAADPMAVLSGFLPDPPPDTRKARTVVVGAGKASARMAEALEAAWPASRSAPLSGLVITRYGHACPCKHIEIVEAAHPVPDAAGAAAAARVLEMVRGLTADDLVIALISGGGSALMTLPADGITLAEKQAINQALLASGAAIGQMNVVRKHLSAIKGGRLAAAAHPARVVGLLISDVPGDDPEVIASGPTVGESSAPADALASTAASPYPPACAPTWPAPPDARRRMTRAWRRSRTTSSPPRRSRWRRRRRWPAPPATRP
jgi:glycerate-2-kinase